MPLPCHSPRSSLALEGLNGPIWGRSEPCGSDSSACWEQMQQYQKRQRPVVPSPGGPVISGEDRARQRNRTKLMWHLVGFPTLRSPWSRENLCMELGCYTRAKSPETMVGQPWGPHMALTGRAWGISFLGRLHGAEKPSNWEARQGFRVQLQHHL